MDSSTQESNISLALPEQLEGLDRPFSWRLINSLRTNWIAAAALIVLFVMILAALFAPSLAPHDPLDVDITSGLRPPTFLPNGDPDHILGTDSLGRDVLSRLIYGARISLLIGFATVALGGLIGMVLGLVSGFYGGWVDNVIMRMADAQLAFPFILLAIAIIAVLGPNLSNLILVLALSSWVLYARLVRGEVLSIKEREYIEAARMVGVTDAGILINHIIPNVLNSFLVIATFSIAQMILAEAALSYLGLGVQLPTPTWGSMLNEARQYMFLNPWLSLFPGLAIMITVLSVNVLGDWLRDLLDPRLQL